MAFLETRTESLSGCPYGELTEVTGTAWNALTAVHTMTVSDVIDVAFVKFWNVYNSSVVVFVVINPADNSSMASVDAATSEVAVPANGFIWAVNGERVRKHSSGSNTVTIAAYVAAIDVGRIRFSGHVDRIQQPEETL